MPQTITTSTDDRAVVKAKILELNRLALDADTRMRESLKVSNTASAYVWRDRRDSYNAESKRLTDWLNAPAPRPVPAPTPVITPQPAISSNNFITTTADAFNASGGSQDYAHNAILKALLDGEYSSSSIPANDAKAAAYDIVRQNNGSPLHWIRNQAQSQALNNSLPHPGSADQRRFPTLNTRGLHAGETFFIRDFMQVYSSGNITIGNLMIVDDTVYSEFAQDFNRLVNSINEYQKQQGRPYRVFPFLRMAHRDAVQLIPGISDGINQFGGAVMNNVSVTGNLIYSDGALQGVFATDGAFRNLHIRSNSLQIGGEHTISINGMLSGSILGNTDINNRPLADSKIALYPLRLGGGANIYVLGFSNKASIRSTDARYYQYEAILGVPATRDFRQQVIPNGTCYRNVDMVELLTLLKGQYPRTPAQWQAVMVELSQRGFAQVVS